jgi:hypothetical protein
MEITVQAGQSLYDIVLQYYGSLDFYLTMVQENNLDIDSTLTVGQKLTVSNELIGDARIKDKYNKIKFIPVNSSEEDLRQLDGDYNGDFNDDYLT